MTRSQFRLAIADREVSVRHEIKAVLERAGHTITVCAADGQSLTAGCLQTPPDLVIVEMDLGDMTGAAAVSLVRNKHDVPIIFSSSNCDEKSVEQAGACRAFTYLLKPIRVEEIEPMVYLAITQHRQLLSLRSAVTLVQQQLADRKVIERAKGVLMVRNKLSEQQAFSQLKRVARTGRLRMAEVARSLLLAEGLLNGI